MTNIPVAALPLEVGATLTFAGDPNPWTVQAVTANFAAATRPGTEADREAARADEPYAGSRFDYSENDGDIYYTVLDWRNGVRGPCNLVGQAYGNGNYTERQCAQMLAEFEAGELEVSHRNRVRIEFGEVAW